MQAYLGYSARSCSLEIIGQISQSASQQHFSLTKNQPAVLSASQISLSEHAPQWMK
jgi:hypothetical protein